MVIYDDIKIIQCSKYGPIMTCMVTCYRYVVSKTIHTKEIPWCILGSTCGPHFLRRGCLHMILPQIANRNLAKNELRKVVVPSFSGFELGPDLGLFVGSPASAGTVRMITGYMKVFGRPKLTSGKSWPRFSMMHVYSIINSLQEMILFFFTAWMVHIMTAVSGQPDSEFWLVDSHSVFTNPDFVSILKNLTNSFAFFSRIQNCEIVQFYTNRAIGKWTHWKKEIGGRKIFLPYYKLIRKKAFLKIAKDRRKNCYLIWNYPKTELLTFCNIDCRKLKQNFV